MSQAQSLSDGVNLPAIWALADLHLCFGAPGKSMSVFGPAWARYTERIEENWCRLVGAEDLVLVPGDISWATKLEDALLDLQWIDRLPGTKLLLRGNHDYWWSSSAKMHARSPRSIHFLHNTAFLWHSVAIGGTRLWDTKEYSFHSLVDLVDNPVGKGKRCADMQNVAEDESIFTKELGRLELSLSQLDPSASLRIAMTHYPPIGADLASSLASRILEKYRVNICVFGHLHSLKQDALPLFGIARGVRYVLTSCDLIDFTPVRIV